ncbi:VUT family protein [Bacillus sp. 165]|uniref:VUT family protein n=1 Tax=Bacillus sp. 165 TaxID=1529117 RepID=UPI001ADB94D4|nr:VUT family protein [Bacillus sp. 165]MBO9128572.1 VUT family protein [Bacillus sp. 165]
MRIILYFISIVLANFVTAAFAPLHLGVFIVPMGTLLIGATFILRDLVQNKYGRTKTYIVIGTALMLSAVSPYLHGDTLLIVLASAISFAISETTDTEIYSRLKLPMSWRIFYSGLVGGLLDSTIFVIIGLSPLGANFLSWEAVPAAIIGQVLMKTLIQGIGALVLNYISKFSNENALN